MKKMKVCVTLLGLLTIVSGCSGNRGNSDTDSSEELLVASKSEPSTSTQETSSSLTVVEQDVTEAVRFETQAVLFGDKQSGIHYVDFSVGLTNLTDQVVEVDSLKLQLSFASIVEGMETLEPKYSSNNGNVRLDPRQTVWLEDFFQEIGNQVLGNYELTMMYDGTPVLQNSAFQEAIKKATAENNMQEPVYATAPLKLENTTWLKSEMNGQKWGIKWDENGAIFLKSVGGEWQALADNPRYSEVQIEKVNDQKVVVSYLQKDTEIHNGMMYPFLAVTLGGIGGGGPSNKGDVEHKTTFVFNPDHTNMTSHEEVRYMVKSFTEGAPEAGDQLNVWSDWQERTWTFTFERE